MKKLPQKQTRHDVRAANAAARARYQEIAGLLKREAGVTRHYKHKMIGGLAWTGTGRILAPAGVTRRQLYVLAHECGHILLHSTREGQSKPSHVKEHEAETYAHRAFQRYGLEVPEKSARWARSYVWLWIMKDRSVGIPICSQAEDFATGRRSPFDSLTSVDGQPPQDFSRKIEQFVEKGTRIVQLQDQADRSQLSAAVLHDDLEMATALAFVRSSNPARFDVLRPLIAAEIEKLPSSVATKDVVRVAFANVQRRLESVGITFERPSLLPNTCATCAFYKGNKVLIDWTRGWCHAFSRGPVDVRSNPEYCDNGKFWRPHPKMLRKYKGGWLRGIFGRR